MTMKTMFLAAFALAALAAVPAVAAPGSTCLRVINIDRTNSPDDRTIIFRMNNGDVWRNDLKNNCPSLRFNGFAYDVTPPNEICGNLQAIRVLRTHSVCLLGPFTKMQPAGHM
jgi:hypothetical protein